MTELSRHRHEHPRPLPVQFRPIAVAIAPNRTARVATGPASQAALRSVGKVAATTGDVIHLARMPSATPTAAETQVLAHELTHVAHASPAPRFYADDRPSPEEARADEIGLIMRRSPILPRAAAGADPVTPLVGRPTMAPSGTTAAVTGPAGRAGALGAIDPVGPGGRARVQRSPSRSASTSSSPSRSSTASTISAAALAARFTGEPVPEPAVSNWDPSSSSVSRSVIQRSPSTTVQRWASATKSPGVARGEVTIGTGRDNAPERNPIRFSALNTTHLLDQFDHLVELLEERIIIELERRGGRFRGGF